MMAVQSRLGFVVSCNGRGAAYPPEVQFLKFAGSISTKLFTLLCVLALVCIWAPAQTISKPSTTTKSASTAHSSHKGKRSKKAAGWRRGQQKIDKQRATEIQEALIREHYLDGKPTGAWDQKTQSALQRYQADNGWQSKNIPDSRALIKLGLGPDQQHLLNPESAMTTPPAVETNHKATTSPSVPDTSSDVPKIPNHLRK